MTECSPDACSPDALHPQRGQTAQTVSLTGANPQRVQTAQTVSADDALHPQRGQTAQSVSPMHSIHNEYRLYRVSPGCTPSTTRTDSAECLAHWCTPSTRRTDSTESPSIHSIHNEDKHNSVDCLSRCTQSTRRTDMTECSPDALHPHHGQTAQTVSLAPRHPHLRRRKAPNQSNRMDSTFSTDTNMI
jgi:hypothetical protein